MPPAIIAGGIAAAGTIGGAIISSNSQKSAANQAAQAQNRAAQVQLTLGQQSLDLQKQLAQQSLGLNQSIYNSNYNLLSPFVSRGDQAGTAINSLLGLPNAPAMHSPLQNADGSLKPITPAPPAQGAPGAGGAPQAGYSGPSLAQIMAMQNDGVPGNYKAAMAAYLAQQPQQNALAPAPAQPMPVASAGRIAR